jgi:hypothetical protein
MIRDAIDCHFYARKFMRFAIFLLSFILSFAISCGEADDEWGPKVLPVAEGARLRLALTRKEYFLGENVLLHYCLENVGRDMFKIDMGGDYRGATRSLRFVVSAADAKGAKVADPDTSKYNLGGMSFQPELKPGETYFESLPLMRYCRFDKPGVYTVKVTHDLGWKKAGGKSAPAADIQITLKATDEAQARELLDAMLHLPANPNATYGQMNEPYADFSVIRHPAFLPGLIALAEKGEKDAENALVGIGSIATPEATAALIRFLGHAKPEVALAAAEILNARLPDPEADGKLKSRSPFGDPFLAQRRELAGASWKAEYAAKVREHAKTLLKGDERRQIDGAFMLQCIGEKEDFADVLAALNAALDKSRTELREQTGLPQAPGASGELIRAGDILNQRGAVMSEEPKTPGEIALFLNALKTRSDFRPKGWEERCATMLNSDVPYLRDAVLASVPAIPAAVAAKLPALLSDADLGVRIAACNAAAKTKGPELREPVLKIIATTKEDALINASATAAYQLGVFREALDTWISRLDEPGMEMKALTTLVRLLVARSGFSAGGEFSPDEVKAIKIAWMEFSKTYGGDFQKGRLFDVGAGELKAEMFPPKFKLYRANNEPWP